MAILALFVLAQVFEALTPQVRKYVSSSAPSVLLEHVRVIDGTGSPPQPDRNVAIAGGKIVSISPGVDAEGPNVLHLRGQTVIPGIVGMHDHLYALLPGDGDRPTLPMQVSFTGSRLYLAAGVTTIRTAGSRNPYAELQLARDIEAGAAPGPHLEVTGPYMSNLVSADEARETVAFWAKRGVTSFKAYRLITREQLRAAVEEAHRRGLKVIGHLCSVTYEEAAQIGIDGLEHGFFVNTALDPGKKPDSCPESGGDFTLEHITREQSDRLIATLLRHHVAVTSTLFSTAAPIDPHPLRPEVADAMSPAMREAYLRWRAKPPPPQAALLLRKDMELERAFVAAGGLLIAGPDPVGIGGNLPGFGDQRQIELLVEAGFQAVEAIRIATLNGATFLGRQDRIGSIQPGKNADLVVVKGDPAAQIADIEKVEIVFKDGVGYDPRKLLDAVKGHYGEY